MGKQRRFYWTERKGADVGFAFTAIAHTEGRVMPTAVLIGPQKVGIDI